VNVARHCGSVLLSWHCNILCTEYAEKSVIIFGVGEKYRYDNSVYLLDNQAALNLHSAVKYSTRKFKTSKMLKYWLLLT